MGAGKSSTGTIAIDLAGHLSQGGLRDPGSRRCGRAGGRGREFTIIPISGRYREFTEKHVRMSAHPHEGRLETELEGTPTETNHICHHLVFVIYHVSVPPRTLPAFPQAVL